MPLRPYQTKAIEALRRTIASGSRRVVLVAPTGAGKTTIAAAMIESACAKGRRVMFLAHRRELIEQCSARLDAHGVEHGIIKAKHWRRVPDALVQVASVQTLIRREPPPTDLIFVDECHRTMSQSYVDILDNYPRAAVVGLTATPWRSDKLGLGEVYDGLVVAAQAEELIEQGHLLQPRIWSAPSLDLSGLKTRGGDYDEAALAGEMNKTALVGNIVSHWQELAENVRTVVFAVDVKHAMAITDRFEAAGVAVAHVNGNTKEAERVRILDGLKDGSIRVVTNVGILTEGYDLPDLGCVVLARPTKSSVLFLQMVGRVLRPCEGKETAMVLDHGGCLQEHGWPTRDRVYELEMTPELEEQEGRRGASNQGLKVCDECGFVFDGRMRVTHCPHCGAEMNEQLQESDGHLEEAHPPGVERRKCGECGEMAPVKKVLANMPRYSTWCGNCCKEAWHTRIIKGATMDEKRREFHRLQTIKDRMGYKDGWVAHKYRAAFGVWPRGMGD